MDYGDDPVILPSARKRRRHISDSEILYAFWHSEAEWAGGEPGTQIIAGPPSPYSLDTIELVIREEYDRVSIFPRPPNPAGQTPRLSAERQTERQMNKHPGQRRTAPDSGLAHLTPAEYEALGERIPALPVEALGPIHIVTAEERAARVEQYRARHGGRYPRGYFHDTA